MTDTSFIEIGDARLEYQRIAATRADTLPLLFLHEGLGSVAMWRDFPAQVAAATGAETIVYSRRGYGRSSKLNGPRAVDYMHVEARETLPAVLRALGVARPVLIGHSDGASISLIYAGSGLPASGLVLMAPHVFVEDITVSSIAAAKETYQTSDLGQRLGRYHDDADHAFRGWNDIWLAAAFLDWNIESFVPGVGAPMLLIQGAQDEYGTLAQIEVIADLARSPCELAVLPDCRHSPHRDQPERTLDLISRFVSRLGGRLDRR